MTKHLLNSVAVIAYKEISAQLSSKVDSICNGGVYLGEEALI